MVPVRVLWRRHLLYRSSHISMRLASYSGELSSSREGLYLERKIRSFHSSRKDLAVRPFLLADIGEGIRECEVIQWFVEPEARVEQFDKLCEVQSDKASVEITSRFDGVIKKLHYEAGDMAIVGKPLVDIDIQSETAPEDEAFIENLEEDRKNDLKVSDGVTKNLTGEPIVEHHPQVAQDDRELKKKQTHSAKSSGSHALLATPAVRHLIKELNVPISSINGSGRDGRVLKEDVYAHTSRAAPPSSPPSAQQSKTQQQSDIIKPLTTIQHQMFKTMTRTLSIPHFLFSDSYDITALSRLRSSINTSLSSDPISNVKKLSYLPFIVKAVSAALQSYPILNARLDTSGPKPALVYRAGHNIGIAIDSPSGLLVPVIKSVQNLSVLEIATEINRLSSLAQASKLSTADFSSGTITVSNIGSIGGTTVAPVIVEGQLAILGIGKVRTVPAFDKEGTVVKREEIVCSWSADHRVVDGATMARFAGVIGDLISAPGRLIFDLR